MRNYTKEAIVGLCSGFFAGFGARLAREAHVIHGVDPFSETDRTIATYGGGIVGAGVGGVVGLCLYELVQPQRGVLRDIEYLNYPNVERIKDYPLYY